MLSMLEDPHARHALLAHLPIVLGALGVVPVLALALTRFRSTPAKLVCIAWFLLASAGAGLAASAGEDAAEGVEDAALTGAEEAALEEHEELGEAGWIWPLIPAALVGVTLLPKKQVRVIAGSLALAGSVGVSVWVAQTAHLGGTLVYVHGLGVPSRGDAGAIPQIQHDLDDHGEDGERDHDD